MTTLADTEDSQSESHAVHQPLNNLSYDLVSQEQLQEYAEVITRHKRKPVAPNVLLQAMSKIMAHCVQTNGAESYASKVIMCLKSQIKLTVEKDESRGPETSDENLMRVT